MGQIKNIKLHIVTDIKVVDNNFSSPWLTRKFQQFLKPC